MLALRNILFVPGAFTWRIGTLFQHRWKASEGSQIGLDPRISYDVGLNDRNPVMERRGAFAAQAQGLDRLLLRHF